MSAPKTLWTLRCAVTGEAQELVLCAKHSAAMEPVGELEEAQPADADLDCEACASLERRA